MQLNSTLGNGPAGSGEGDLVAVSIPQNSLVNGDRIKVCLTLQTSNTSSCGDSANVLFKFYFGKSSPVSLTASPIKNGVLNEIDMLEFYLQRVGADLYLFDTNLGGHAGLVPETTEGAIDSGFGQGYGNGIKISSPDFTKDNNLRISAVLSDAGCSGINANTKIIPLVADAEIT
jgi:hypothetical protein